MLFELAILVMSQAQVGSPAIPKSHVASPPKPTQTVAVVNGQPIRAQDVEAMLWQWRGQEATEELIGYLLIAQDAARHGVKVTDAEVEVALDSHLKLLAKSAPGGPKNLNTYLRDQGFTRSRIFLRKKAELLVERVIAKGFTPKQFVSVSTIIIKPANDQLSSLPDAIAKADKAHSRLASGEGWDKVLADYTKDPNGLKNKGKLGWREANAFPPTVQKELESTNVGGFTKPAQTQFGIQIFRLDAKGTEAKGKELDELRAFYMQVRKPEYVRQLQASAKIDRRLK